MEDCELVEVLDAQAGSALPRVTVRPRTGGGVVFASTADAVIAHPRVGRRLCQQGIFNYLYQETVPAPGP
jgi:hypothetical protein